MTKNSSMMRKVMVLVMAFAIMLTYSVVPMNQSFAASGKKPTKITLNAKSKTLTVGQTFKAKVKSVKPKKASKAVKWKSSNKKVATVSSKGVITAKKAGKATITAVSKKNKKAKAKIKVTVKNAVVPEIPDNQVFVDPAYVDALLHSGRSDVVVAEVSWGPDAPKSMIPGAIHVNTDDLEDNLKDGKVELWDLRGCEDGYKELIAALGSYGITTDKELVCYSWNGIQSAPTRLAMAALMMGVQKVRVLDGGSDAWENAGYAMGTKAAAPKAASFGRTTPLHPEWVISTEDLVKKAASDSNFKPVSIRSYDEFIGMSSGYGYVDKAGEPKGAVWGHDTDDGSYLKEDGTFVGTDVIDAYLKPYGASTKNELAFYCGTGWRATIPFLICYQAGITNMKLWDDGWYVYSGAFADEWNSPEYKPEMKPVGDYPVQIGDPAKGSVKYTTTNALEGKYCPLGAIMVNEATVSAKTTGKLESNFTIKPPKKTALNSVKFTSSNPAVASVDATGAVTVNDASKFTTVTIKAETYATAGSTPEKAGSAAKTASYTLQVGETPDFVNMPKADWDKYGIEKTALKDSDVLIDVRTSENFKLGHLAGSVSSPVANPYTDEQQSAIVNVFYNNLDADRIVIICNTGNMLARNAMQALVDAGCDISKVTYLIGGYNGWKDTNPYVIGKVKVDPAAKTATIKAKVNAAYLTADEPFIYHLIKSEGVGDKDAAFVSEADVFDFHSALTALGSKPWSDTSASLEIGQTLSDAAATGVGSSTFSHYDVTVGEKTLAEVLKYKKNGADASPASALDMAFSGNYENQLAWKSGCISCLQSCPAGIVTNNAVGFMTVSKETDYFCLDSTKLQAGQEVAISFKLK